MMKVHVVPEDNSKKAKAKAWVKNRLVDIRCFWPENKEAIVTLTPVVVGGVTVLARVIGKHNRLVQETKLKELYVWDPKLGMYYQLRKKMTNEQRLELDRRKNAGESIGNILASMKVLKL